MSNKRGIGPDAPLVILCMYLFSAMNFYGWGILHDRRFIVFVIIIGLLYLFSDWIYSLVQAPLLIKLKIALLLFFIGVAIFIPTINIIHLRQKTSPVGFINDSGLQTEIAGRFLLLGKNPYAESYINTDLADWAYVDDAGNTLNPALFQNVTPPFLIVMSALGFRVFSQLGVWFDIRMIFLIAYFFLLVLGFLKFGLKNNLLLFFPLVCLNPIFLNSMMQGSNDIVVLSFLLWSLFFLEKKQTAFSGFFLGLSIAAKQAAWLAIPFYLFYVLKNFQKKKVWRFILSFILISGIFYAPFLIWNFQAVLSNLVFYINGSPYLNLPIHPIEGYSFGTLLHSLGIIKSIYDRYPFWFYQIIFGLPILGFSLFIQRKKMTLWGLFYSYSIFTAIIWFFNRYLLNSHLSFLMVIVAVSYLWSIK